MAAAAGEIVPYPTIVTKFGEDRRWVLPRGRSITVSLIPKEVLEGFDSGSTTSVADMLIKVVGTSIALAGYRIGIIGPASIEPRATIGIRSARIFMVPGFPTSALQFTPTDDILITKVPAPIILDSTADAVRAQLCSTEGLTLRPTQSLIIPVASLDALPIDLKERLKTALLDLGLPQSTNITMITKGKFEVVEGHLPELDGGEGISITAAEGSPVTICYLSSP